MNFFLPFQWFTDHLLTSWRRYFRGYVEPKDNHWAKVSKYLSPNHDPCLFQTYYFIKSSQQLCEVGVAPILQIKKFWRRLSHLVKKKIQVFQCPCFSTPSLVLFRPHCGFLLCQKFLLSEKTKKTSMECSKSEVINLIHLPKKNLGWQTDRKQGLNFWFCKGT